MFKLKNRTPLWAVVRGLSQKVVPIQYEERVADSNWEPCLSNYVNQKWGIYDTNSCWMVTATNSAKVQMAWLEKNGFFSVEAIKFFTDIGYRDSNGVYSFSERFLEIEGNRRDAGGTSPMAWQMMYDFGCIPRSMLTYSDAEAQKWHTREGFLNDYFNPAAVTPEMLALGRKFRTYVNIAYQQIGKSWTTPSYMNIEASLKMAPLCYGIPVPEQVQNWNNAIVEWDRTNVLAHEVMGYKTDPNKKYPIFDQYEPHLKWLSSDYPLDVVTQGILYSLSKPVTAPTMPPVVNPTPEQTYWQKFWTAVQNYWNGIPNPFQIG